jgi:hypothetical protein
MGRINDGFGMRKHPITGEQKMHWGQDYTTKTGVPIYTNIPMTVVESNVQNGFGKIVTLQDDSGNTYKYAHLDDMTVKKGEKIPPDTLIGYVGNTGGSTGSHLHFESIDRNGKHQNPMHVNPDTGKLWSDVSGFTKGQTLNQSIKTAVPDPTKYGRPATAPAATAAAQAAANKAAAAAAAKKLSELEAARRAAANKTGPGSNSRPRPDKKDVGIIVNPRHKHGD